MATARYEEEMDVDMDVDSVTSTVPGPRYRWGNYASSDPKLFSCRFVYEDLYLKHRWKITDIQYKLIKYFCCQEEEKLKHRSTCIYSHTHTIECIDAVLSEEIKSIVKEIETKLSEIWYVEMNQSVSDKLRYNSSFLQRLNTTDCLVYVPDRRICIFSSYKHHLYDASEALCTEFKKRKGVNSGTNCKFRSNPDDMSTQVFSSDRSYSSTSLSMSTSSSVTNNQENDEVLIGSLKVKVFCGSILNAKVDAIVNAANDCLTFDAGVSSVIHKAAGFFYERGCLTLLRQENSILQTSKCYASDPGRLKDKFKLILHAVGPRWDDYEKKEECFFCLADTVTNVLKMADSSYIASVAMPAISSGNSRVPIELCAIAYIVGILQFGTGIALREVQFVDTDQTVVDEMKTACSKYKENPLSIMPETPMSLYLENLGTSAEDIRNWKSASPKNAQVAIALPAASNILPLQYKEGSILVKVYQGSALKVKADAVVNATNEALSHGAICDAAGEEFDDECQRMLRYLKSSIKTTQVLATGSGNLKKQFKYILNAVCPRWDQYQEKTECLSDLHDTIVNILNEAEKLHIRSVVIPANSSGIFGVPLKLCAEMYLQGIISFSRHTALYLKEIHIVDIDVSVLREMTDAYHNYKKNPDSISIRDAKTRYPALMKAMRSLSETDRDDEKSGQQTAKVAITRSSASNIQPLQFTEGYIQVKVYVGSILYVKADALVNAANETLSHGAGVALAICDAAGREFDEECQRKLRLKGSLKTTQVLATCSGNLKNQFKYILNAVGPIWSRYSDKTQCLSDLHDTIVNILNEAENLHVRTLVMPAICCGIFRVPLKLCAEMYLQGIISFSRQTALYLKEIHIVDIDVSVLREMTDAYHNYKKNPDSISISGAKTRYPALMKASRSLSVTDRDDEKSAQQPAKVAKSQPAASNIQSLMFKERNIQVKVSVESILNVKADALVNAANEALSHGAGVALAVCDAAGREFDDDCQRKLRLKGSLKTTQVLTTTPGNLINQFRHILNAVGPIWNWYSDKTQCLSDLHDTIVNILNEAEKLRVRSLVMPAISCGIFGVPLKLCAEMYLQGIINFSRQTALYLKEIHIVDIDVNVLREMTDAYHNYKKSPDSISIHGAKTRHPALMKALRSSSVFDMDDKRDHVDTTQQRNSVRTPRPPEFRSTEQRHTENLPQSKGGCLFKMKDEKFGSQIAKVFSFQNKMVVKIYTGSIVRFQGDALICSNDDGMLGIGPLAKAVAAGGGSKYNESYSKLRSKSLYGTYKWKFGDVETCSGGDLNVRFVVHAVIQSMSRTDQESLRYYTTTLRKIFNTINSYNNSTRFAMPLIGAGLLAEKAEDLQQCCQTFFQVLTEFFNDHQSDFRIRELHLINRNPKVTQTLIDIFKCNCTQPSEYKKSPVKNEQKSGHLSFTAPSNDENTSTKFPVQRQHSWTNSTETTEEQAVGPRGLGARPKTSTRRSQSMYVKNSSARATRSDRKYRESYTGDSGHLTEAKSSMDNQSMKKRTEGEKTKAKEGNLLIISDDDDDDDEKSHDKTHDDDQKSHDETSLHDVPSVESIDDETATCVICLDDVKDSMKLDCNHEFCKSCLTQSFSKHKKACPICGKIFGEITGNQPPGVISFEKEGRSLPGYENCGTIIVKYNFKSGIQGSEHPNPGQPYEGTERRGFLPDNEEGRKVRRLLEKAFDRRLVFTIGYSRTTGKDNVVTWNDIHHKTKRDTGAQRFGYPDPTYLQRVQEELAAKGVTE